MSTNVNSSTTSQWLHKATRQLEKADISTARLDCLVLLEDFAGKDRAWLLANPDFKLSDTTSLDKQIARRAKYEPLAYIRGKTEFYGREFVVNAHTLEPRPETETMIDLLKELIKPTEKVVIVDVGTGSGCIAITAKLELPKTEVWAIDIDQECIKTARANAIKLEVDINFCLANLLDDYSQGMTSKTEDTIICANLPYVPNKYQLNEAAKFEPQHAIFGGKDGLDLYRELFEQIEKLEYKPQFILTESLPFQQTALEKIAKKRGYELDQTEDFIQIFILPSV